MDALLKHMLEVTGHRDHQLLEVSILSAVWQMAGASAARMLSIVREKDSEFVRARAWINTHELRVVQDAFEAEAPLEAIPANLRKCLNQGAGHAKSRSKDGKNMLWLPIWNEETATSCLEICKDSSFTRATLDKLEGMVGVYRNFNSLLEYSERDSLTGLLNRKTFERHFSRAKLHEQQAVNLLPDQPERRQTADNGQLHEWLAVADIDHFKHVNDNFGHLYGDEVLILVANLMTSSFREADRIFRFGGEEFVILLHAASLEDVKTIVERFRHTVESHVFPQVGKITVSVGYTSFHPKESPVEVLGHADQALYFAKTHGRNRSCHYEQLVANGELIVNDDIQTGPIEYF